MNGIDPGGHAARERDTGDESDDEAPRPANAILGDGLSGDGCHATVLRRALVAAIGGLTPSCAPLHPTLGVGEPTVIASIKQSSGVHT